MILYEVLGLLLFVTVCVALMAGLNVETGGATINRLCGSSLQALNQASHAIVAGGENVQIVLSCSVTSYCAAEFMSQEMIVLEERETGRLVQALQRKTTELQRQVLP